MLGFFLWWADPTILIVLNLWEEQLDCIVCFFCFLQVLLAWKNKAGLSLIMEKSSYHRKLWLVTAYTFLFSPVRHSTGERMGGTEGNYCFLIKTFLLSHPPSSSVFCSGCSVLRRLCPHWWAALRDLVSWGLPGMSSNISVSLGSSWGNTCWKDHAKQSSCWEVVLCVDKLVQSLAYRFCRMMFLKPTKWEVYPQKCGLLQAYWVGVGRWEGHGLLKLG